MPEPRARVFAVSALATILTLLIGAPVLLAPSDRVFGMAIAGRHHDPFTVMEQFQAPIHLGLYSQPVTDVSGALLARLTGPVAAYNWLVLLSFPLSAAATYLLARHLTLSTAGATLAALAFAFSPFHLAQAAYHVHIAQTQWVPLFFFALWRAVDSPTPLAVAGLAGATLTVALSNFYGGLITAVLTPVALAAYWLLASRTHPRPSSRLAVTVGALSVIAAAAAEYALYAAGPVLANRAGFAFPRADLFRYSARWWSYLVPPVAHPVLGAAARRLWSALGAREGLLEQQVTLGWGIVALGVIVVSAWLVGKRQPAALSRVPVLAIVAGAALLYSLSPERTVGAFTFVRPSALLYELLPMFRAYARFGVVVQLMAALLAGIGFDHLRTAGTRRGRIAGFTLVALAAFEYAVSPSALWRDVLPTTAHRWLMQQPGRVQALDCVPVTPESGSVPWLTGHRLTLLGDPIGDCGEPNLAQKLAANGYTHLLVRYAAGRPSFRAGQARDGLGVVADFTDAELFAVTAPRPAIYTAAMTGFFPREHDAAWSWRWMGSDATWTVANDGIEPRAVALGLELSAFPGPRHLELWFDGVRAQTLEIAPSRGLYRVGPILISPGVHDLLFHPSEAPWPAGDVLRNGDERQLSFALGTWSWMAPGAPW